MYFLEYLLNLFEGTEFWMEIDPGGYDDKEMWIEIDNEIKY